MVQFLLDERDSLLESLDAEEAASLAIIDDNLEFVESEAADVDKLIADIHNHIGGKTNFEVSWMIGVFSIYIKRTTDNVT